MTKKFNELKQKMEEIKTLGLEFKNNAYYRDDGDNKYGPYCSSCYDFYDKLVNLHIKRDSRSEEIYFCPKCKTEIEKSDEND